MSDPELPETTRLRLFAVDHGDEGWSSEFVGQADGSILLRVSGPGGRSWQGQKPDINAAIALSKRIIEDQRGAEGKSDDQDGLTVR